MATATGPAVQGGQHEQGLRARARSVLPPVASTGVVGPAYQPIHGPAYLGDLAPDLGDLARHVPAVGGVHRPKPRGNPRAGRRDPARVVTGGAAATRGRRIARVEANRRTRLDPTTGRQLAAWLHRVARVHAHLCAIVRLYGRPDRAGGQSLQGEAYAARAARGDRTLLYDCLTVSRDELDAIRIEVQQVMDGAPPTASAPGTTGKVDEMARRAERGESLFQEGDADGPA
jgi:hypothetical protein